MRATRPASIPRRAGVARGRTPWALAAAVAGTLAPGLARGAVERGEDPPPAAAAADDDGGDCEIAPVWVTRSFPHGHRERARLRLVDCDGAPNVEVLDALSLLARPYHAERPSEEAIDTFREEADPEVAARFVAPEVMRLDPGLLVRLQTLSERFPGRRIAIVSGYRPDARPTSRHRHGRALDLKIGGTPRRDVADAARGLPETGVGYYPNSVFTHVDVRDESAAWCDWSGPGEPPRYGPWPDRADETPTPEEALLASILDRIRASLSDEGDAAAALAALTDAPDAEGEGPPAVALADAADPEEDGPPAVALADAADPEQDGPPAVALADAADPEEDGPLAVALADAEADGVPPEPPPPPLTREALDTLLASIRAAVDRVGTEAPPASTRGPAEGTDAEPTTTRDPAQDTGAQPAAGDPTRDTGTQPATGDPTQDTGEPASSG